MAGERKWVETLRPKLAEALASLSEGGTNIVVETGRRLTYALEVLDYGPTGQTGGSHDTTYQTDLLIADRTSEGRWTPRVVVECKKGGVSTHDALTYSTKAATHKHVHPYLRYGILIGGLGGPVPLRLFRHGAHFDFMIVFGSLKPTYEEWSSLEKVLSKEIRASRRIQEMLTDKKKRKTGYRLVHRQLVLK